MSIHLGYDAASGQAVLYDASAHMVTIAPTRSGKGTDAVIPTLLTLADKSVIALDLKGELGCVTAAWREDHVGPVFFVNPFRMHGLPVHGFNPLAALDPANLTWESEAKDLAAAIVIPTNSRDAHFDDSARMLIWALIEWACVGSDPPGVRARKDLIAVRDWLFDNAALERLFKAMAGAWDQAREGRADPRTSLLRAAGNRFEGKLAQDDREFASVLSTARTQAEFLLDPNVAANLMRSDVRFRDLRTRRASVYVIVPAVSLESQSRWLRLVLTRAVADLASDAAPNGAVKTLMVMDEFAALNRFPLIAEAFGYAAGYGLTFWAIVQDIPQLEALYEKRWQSLLSNSGALQVFTPNDSHTAGFVSERCGERIGHAQGMSVGDDGRMNLSRNEREVRNYPTTALYGFAKDRALIVRAFESQACQLKRQAYYANPTLQRRAAPNPYHDPQGWNAFRWRRWP